MYKNSKVNIITPLLIAAALVIGSGMSRLMNRAEKSTGTTSIKLQAGDNAARSGDKISTLMSLISRYYVDSVSLDTIAEHVIPKIVEELDPHSVYIPLKEFDDANEMLNGEFEGIGVVFNMATDTVIVLTVISGGPSFEAGVQNGDRIITINDSIVAGRKINQNNIVKQLRGKKGTMVRLGIERYGMDKLIPITVKRGTIPIKSLDAAFMIDSQRAYVKLSRFSRTSHKELSAALGKLKNQGMNSLIFDLRGNSGGFLDQAINIANEFLPANKLIVYTLDRYKNKTEQHSDGRGTFTDHELTILIDEGSASSSEILAGAIQDNDRGVLIGRRSFGKGLVQEQMQFKDGSAVRLTVARYYTPTGRSIQKPYDKGVKAYNHELNTRFLHDELFNADSIKFVDSLKYTTPMGRTVYGGGGIMPDIFIPLDTTETSPFIKRLYTENLVYRYTIVYSDRHRSELNKIGSMEDLNRFFASDKRFYDDFVAYASSKGINTGDAYAGKSKEIISAQLKAIIGRNSPMEDNAFYYYMNSIDSVVKAAMKDNRAIISGKAPGSRSKSKS